jgi:hypothetical protein
MDPRGVKSGSTGGELMAAKKGIAGKTSGGRVGAQDKGVRVCTEMYAFSFPCYPSELVDYLSNYFPMNDVEEC